MSAAASLAALRREGHPIPHNPPNVNLTQLPLTASLSDRAAAARNALALLSTADPTLPTFEKDLHLFDTSFDRATLSPDSQKALTSAVTRLTLRLTPVFLTRPCTALLEWLLHTFHLPTLGSKEEIDGLMLCALPFHETEQFVAVSRILLRSPNAKRWRWLVEVVKTGRLVDTAFCVSKAPLRLFKRIIARAVQCVKEGVAVTPLAALVANFVGRRMVSDDRPALALHCVDALLELVEASCAAENLLCALLTALASAVSYGLELQVMQAIASALVRCLSRSDNSSAVIDTSIALLALCLRQQDRILSPRDAKMLLKVDKLQTWLLCLGSSQSVDTYRDIINCAIASGKPSERLLRLVGRALEEERLMSAESTTNLVQSLLDMCAKASDDDGESFAEERTAHIASLLMSLFRGKFSDAVDDVLHHHLFHRKAGKQDKKKFHLIDASLSRALDRIISGRVEDLMSDETDALYPLSVDILCLSHPDKKRRKTALESISSRELDEKGANEKELRRLVARLAVVVQFERDQQLMVTALEIVNRIPECLVSSEVIKATLMRCSSDGIKNLDPSLERDKLALLLLALCEKISKDRPVMALATLLILSFKGLLDRCCENDDGRERINRLCESFGILHGSSLEGSGTQLSTQVNDVTDSIAQVILNQTDQFVDMFSTVADMHTTSISALSALWMKHLWAKLSKAERPAQLRVVAHRILSLVKLHPKVAQELVSTFEKEVESVLGHSEAPKRENAAVVWDIASELKHWRYQEVILTHLVKVLGLHHTIDILRKGCFDLANSDEARKVSLEWYINFCILHPDDEIGKEAVVTASRIAYGDDAYMRGALDEIWSRRSELNRRKREKKSLLWDFLQLLSSLPEQASPIDIVDSSANLLYAEMRGLEENATFLRRTVKGRLCEVSLGAPNRKTFETHLASNLMCRKQIEAEDLYLLRALGGSLFSGRDDREKLYPLLESALLQLKDSSDSTLASESVHHLVLLIVSSGKPNNPALEARSLAKTLASVFLEITVASEHLDPILTRSLLCLMGFMISFDVPKGFPEKDSLVEALLAQASLSTGTGGCARRVLGLLVGEDITGNQLLHHLNNLSLTRGPKIMSSQNGIPLRKETQLSTRAALGAVRVISQWMDHVSDEPQGIDASLIHLSLSELWKLVKTIYEDHEGTFTSAETRHPEQITVVLNGLTILHRALSRKAGDKGREAAMEAEFDALISVAFGEGSINPVDDPAVGALQHAAHDLVSVLVTCLESGVRYVLPKLLQSQTFAGDVSLIIKLLERVMRTMIVHENELVEIAEVVADAAYNEPSKLSREARMSIMRTLMNNRSPAIGALRITKACLRELYNRESRISGPSTAAKECSSFLREAQLACDQDIACMIFMEGDVNCRITCAHFVSPEFLAKLGSLADDGDARKISSVDEGLSRLFLVLLRLPTPAQKEPAIRLLLASIPLSGMQLCTRTALESDQLRLRIEALRYLAERIATESLPLFPTWRSSSDESAISTKIRQETERSFLENFGSRLCDLITIQGTLTEEIEIREAATDTLQCLSERLGPASYTVVQEFASRICVLSTEGSDVVRALSDKPGRALLLRGKVLECIASFTSVLTKYSLPFVPYLLESSLAILEEFCASAQNLLPDPKEKNYRASVFVTAAAIKALRAVLTSCPMFFGGKALRRLILVALETKVEAPRELLRDLAVREVPANLFFSVFGNFATVDEKYIRDASLNGLLGLVESVSSGVSRMFKSEIKLNWERVLNLLLRCIECARDVSVLLTDEEPENGNMESQSDTVKQNGTMSISRVPSAKNENRLTRYDELDSACARVLVKMVLKLSESEFESVFKALLLWFDGGSLPDTAITACEDHGIEVEKNLPRTQPFFAIMEELLSVLKTIMIPYFMQLTTRLTTIIGRKIPRQGGSKPDSASGDGEHRPKKRSRAAADESQACSMLICQQILLRDNCVQLLASFFNLEFPEGLLNSLLVGEVQEALLSAFDDLEGESEGVSRALEGLAKRIVLPGISSDAKKNQDMLIGLVRDVLSRTKDANAKLRAGALNTCKKMAAAVGDEFLATLPESMPILAEVIDDEEYAVSKAAEIFVLFLESMAREPILQQLK